MNAQHLVAMLNLINLASQRGAFRGEELGDVGVLFNVIKAEVEKLQQPVEESEPEVESVSGEVLS
jgi:hypothetical protein